MCLMMRMHSFDCARNNKKRQKILTSSGFFIVFTIHRDTGKCRRLDVCCRQAQIYKQCCFATLTNNKNHALASELAGMAFIIRDHYVVTVYISEFGSVSLIFADFKCIHSSFYIISKHICLVFVHIIHIIYFYLSS